MLEEGLTRRQISIVLKIKQSALSRLIKRARENKVYISSNHMDALAMVSDKRIRLHGQEFNLRILRKPRFFEKSFVFEGHKVRWFSSKKFKWGSLELYSKSSFYGCDADEAFFRGLDYWRKCFRRLQAFIGSSLLDSRARSVRQVKAHYAEIDNELAIDALDKRYKIKVKGKDGLVWFVVDDSFNLREAETVHPQASRVDMQDTVSIVFNQYRDHPNVRKPLHMDEQLTMVIASVKNLGRDMETLGIVLKPILDKAKSEKIDLDLQPKGKPDYVG